MIVYVTISDTDGTVFDRYEVVVPDGQVNRAGILRDARDMAEVGVTKWGEDD